MLVVELQMDSWSFQKVLVDLKFDLACLKKARFLWLVELVLGLDSIRIVSDFAKYHLSVLLGFEVLELALKE